MFLSTLVSSALFLALTQAGQCPGACEVEASKVFLEESKSLADFSKRNLNDYLKTCDNEVAKLTLFGLACAQGSAADLTFLDAVVELNATYTNNDTFFNCSAPQVPPGMTCNLANIYKLSCEIEEIYGKAQEVLDSFAANCYNCPDGAYCQVLIGKFTALYEEFRHLYQEYLSANFACLNTCPLRDLIPDCGCREHEVIRRVGCNSTCPTPNQLEAAKFIVEDIKIGLDFGKKQSFAAVADQCCCRVNGAHKEGAVRTARGINFSLLALRLVLSPPPLRTKALETEAFCPFASLIPDFLRWNSPHRSEVGRSSPEVCSCFLNGYFDRANSIVSEIELVLSELVGQCKDGEYCRRLVEIIRDELLNVEDLSAIIDACTGCLNTGF